MSKDDLVFVLMILSTPPFAMAIGAVLGYLCCWLWNKHKAAREWPVMSEEEKVKWHCWSPIGDGEGIDIKCPVCGSNPGQQCSDIEGTEWATKMHTARQEIALEWEVAGDNDEELSK